MHRDWLTVPWLGCPSAAGDRMPTRLAGCADWSSIAWLARAQKYDVLQFKVGPALESGVIPLVLAPIWLLYGYLTPLLDTVFKDKPATQARHQLTEKRSVKMHTYRPTEQPLL